MLDKQRQDMLSEFDRQRETLIKVAPHLGLGDCMTDYLHDIWIHSSNPDPAAHPLNYTILWTRRYPTNVAPRVFYFMGNQRID